MTPLLSFLNVSKSYPDGDRELRVLNRVSLEIDAGVSVGVYGPRRTGKSTLLRLAAGIALPDSGMICFEGRDIARMPGSERGRLLRAKIAFISAADWRANPGESVLDHVATSLGSEGLTMRDARRRAMHILDRVEIAAGAEELTTSLSQTERARVMLARALARTPRLLVLDEPALLPSLGERERFYALLRAEAKELDSTLLLASEEMSALQGVGVIMSIGDGEVVGPEERGTVVRLPGRRRAHGERPGQ
jgi:ABC-type lipoprotein export system ATPase subunit